MDFKHIPSSLRVIFTGFLLFCSSAVSQELNTALSYYNQGDFKSAREELKKYLDSNPLDFEALYYAGKLENQTEKSVQYFKKIWEGSSKVKKEESALELCLYYRTEGLNDSLLELCSEFKRTFPQSPLTPQLLWLEGQAFLFSGKIEQSIKGFKNIVELYPFSPWAAWAQLEMGEVYFSQGNYNKSLKEYNKVVDKYAETEAFPLALSGIYRAFENSGEKDKAILYLNLYKEKYPEGIDLAGQVLFEEIAIEKDPGKAEKLTGTKYAVQIGVFANKENADRKMKKLRTRGYDVEQSYRIIKDKRYYVIRVGSLDSIPEAQRLREELEREEGEVYRIVIK